MLGLYAFSSDTVQSKAACYEEGKGIASDLKLLYVVLVLSWYPELVITLG